jgi:5-formyltetrahydrofolate cyclo-ligase
MKSEADIHLLLEELLLRGDTVFLPCFENSTLIFRQVLDFDHLRKGALGVLEPTQDEPVLTSGEGDIVLVPGRAFDRTGNRMGRGNGGYDKWIRKQRKMNPETLFVGIALECQLVGSVPTEPHDEPIDAIATARGLVDAVKEI